VTGVPTIFVDFDFVGQVACAALAYFVNDPSKRTGAAKARAIGNRIDVANDIRKLWEACKPNDSTADASKRIAKLVAGQGFVETACRLPLTEAELFSGLQ